MPLPAGRAYPGFVVDVMGYLVTVAILLLVASVIVIAVVIVYAKTPLEKKYENSGGGFGGSFDAIWMPSAYEAGMERDRQTRRTAPAPAPGDPPSTIDGDRIVIDI
jgi:NADH:ubiquinone oxidoreductase subunit 3 (subunit A)